MIQSGIANALFPKGRQRLLAVLYGQPERSFYSNELVRLTGSGTGSVQRELESLVASGLVTTERQGNQRHYQANADAPVFSELRGIVIKTFGIADWLRQTLSPFAARILVALLYGSVAKGTDKAGSDIDVLVVSNDLTLEELFRTLEPLEKQLGRHISPTLYTSAEFLKRRKAGNAFLTKVLSGERIVLIGSENAVG